MSMFTQAERERIAATISELEQRTAAEIVVAEVRQSDDYAEVRSFAALVASLAGGSAVHLLWPGLGVGAILGVQLVLSALAWLLAGLSPLLRALTPAVRLQRAVERAAELSFFEHAVFRTRERTGVLVFLSALEHRVVILGDEGIHARLQNPGWSELVRLLVLAVKQGRAGEGVCEVIGKLGESLARDVAIREDDTNELDNRVRGPERA